MIGVAILLPSGSTPGSTSRRVIRFNNLSGPFVTRGPSPQPPSTWRSVLKRLGLGFGLIAVGVVMIISQIGWD